MPCCCKKLAASPLVSSKSMPRTTTCLPCACICRQLLSSSGSSSLQGEHHEAQKLRTTALPLKSVSASVLLLPGENCSAGNEKTDAGCPMSGSEAAFGGAGVSNCVNSSASSPTFSRLTPQKIRMVRLLLFFFAGS